MDPYKVLKNKLNEMYDLGDFHQAQLLMALPPAAGDMRPSELMDRMKALIALEAHLPHRDKIFYRSKPILDKLKLYRKWYSTGQRVIIFLH